MGRFRTEQLPDETDLGARLGDASTKERAEWFGSLQRRSRSGCCGLGRCIGGDESLAPGGRRAGEWSGTEDIVGEVGAWWRLGRGGSLDARFGREGRVGLVR